MMRDPWTTIRLDGRTFRADACGFYEELIEVPLDSLVMSEGGQYSERVQLCVKMHRAGSPFPPIAVTGVTPGCPRYQSTNGHRRFLRQAQDRFLRQARAIIAERYTVPEEVRKRNNRRARKERAERRMERKQKQRESRRRR